MENYKKKFTVGFGQDFDQAEFFFASDTEGVRARAAPR